MTAGEVVARLLLQIFFVVIMLSILLIVSRSPDAGVIFGLAIILAIPGIIVTLVLYVPIEAACLRRQWRGLSWVLVPLGGVVAPWLLFPFSGNTNNFLAGVLGLSPLGAFWGLFWIITRPIYSRLKSLFE